MVITLLRDDGSTHSIIEFRSADNPDSLRGEGVHAAVIDEAGYWSRDSFVSVWTTLTRTRGKLRIISTPKGRNWFYDEWIKGWDGDGSIPALRRKHPEYKSYQLPTASNPHIPRESLEEAKRNLTDLQYRQEYMAEFLADSAGVFRNIRTCQRSELLPRPVGGRRYVIGVDWAKHEDYTVITVMDVVTKAIVHMERYNGEDWNININRAIIAARTWNQAMLCIDATGVGDVPYDSIRAVYPHVYGYNIFNNAEKVALIQKLQFQFERGEISIPHPDKQSRAEYRAIAEVLEHELQMYGYTMSQQGKFQFSAPEGYHDDCVISLALANWMATEEPFVYKARQVAGV
jgi:phage FluMu gp28-like protein